MIEDIDSGITSEDQIWHVICHKGFLFLQEVDGHFEWVKRSDQDIEYRLTANNAMYINMMLENHVFSREYIINDPEDGWDGVCTSREIALMVAKCHNIDINDLELVRQDGERFPMRLSEGVIEVFNMLYVDIPRSIRDVYDILDE